MILTQTSVSQVETASHDQQGGCARKWWFSAVNGLRPDQSESAAEGVAGHAHLAHYFRTGELPQKRSKMSKAATAALLKPTMLPKFGTEDVMVELRFDGQEQLYPDRRCHCGHLPDDHESKGCQHLSDGRGTLDCTCEAYAPLWIPLDVANTLHLGGLPWEGFIDLTWRNGDVPTIVDHKFFTPARPDLYPDPYVFLKKPSQLLQTVQLPIYVMNMRRYWPDAMKFEIAHHCVSKKGVDSLIRSSVVTVDQVLERADAISTTVQAMKSHALATNQDDVPANTKPDANGVRPCEAWNGCPHQSICSAFLNRNTNKGTTVALSESELAIFDAIPLDAPASPELTPDQIQTAAANDAAVAADKARLTKIAEAKAAAKKAADELAALEAPPAQPAPAPKVHRVVMHDEPAPVLAPDAPASKPELASEKPPAPAPAPAPKPTKKKAEAPPPAPAAAPTRVPGESASERAATAALPSHAAPAKPPEPDLHTAASEFLRSRFTGESRGIDTRDTAEIVSLVHAALAIVTKAA